MNAIDPVEWIYDEASFQPRGFKENAIRSEEKSPEKPERGCGGARLFLTGLAGFMRCGKWNGGE
jgi:hypothetical protein